MKNIILDNSLLKELFTSVSKKGIVWCFLLFFMANFSYGNDFTPNSSEANPPAFTFFNPVTGLATTSYIIDTLCPGQTVDNCLVLTSESDNHNIISFAGNVGTVVITPPTTPFDTCFSYTAPAGFTGYDTVTLTVENALGNTGTVDVQFLIVDPNTPAQAGANQQLCSMTTANLSAVDPDPLASSGTWTVLDGGASITSPNLANTGVTNLLCGENSFIWKQEYVCGATQLDTTYIFVFDVNAPIADAGPDVDLCDNTYNMLANAQQCSGVGTWDAISGNSTTWNINDPNSLITNIGIGENCFEWHIDNGPCPTGETVDAMCIYVYDSNHPPAVAGPDQEYCTDGFLSAPLSGSSIIFPAVGHWENLGGVGTGVIDDPLQINTIVTGMDIGDNGFIWVVDNGPCGLTTDTLIITMFDGGLTLSIDAGPDVEYCTPTTSHDMTATALPYPANGHWELVSGAGVMVDYTNPTETVTNLAVGDNYWAWVAENGACDVPLVTVADTLLITVYSGPQAAADAGPDDEFCITDVANIPLLGNAANYPATGLWTVTNGLASFTDDTDPNTTVTLLSQGSIILVWTITNGVCDPPVTSDEVEFIVFPVTSPPAISGPDVTFCTPQDAYTMQGVFPTFPSTGEWTLISSPGSPSFDADDATTTVSNLPVGESVFRWTILNGPCPDAGNFAEMTITIFNHDPGPTVAGPDQDICSDLNPLEVTMAGSPLTFPQTGTWAITQGGGTIVDLNDPNTLITNLPEGINIYTWTTYNGPCGPGDSNIFVSDAVTINVFPIGQGVADAGSDQEICSNSSSTVLAANGYSAPTTGLWTLITGTGIFTDATNPNTVVTGLSVGLNVFRWTIDNSPCVPGLTTDDVTVEVFNVSQNVVDAGPDQLICSDLDLVIMSATVPINPAVGIWTITSGAGTFADATNPNTTITNLGLGDNIFTWSISNGPCPAIATDDVLIQVNEFGHPVTAGPDQYLCSDVPATNLAGNEALYAAEGTWIIISSPNAGIVIIDDIHDENTGISNLPVGETVFQWTIDNSPCLPNTVSDEVSIFVYDDVNQGLADAGPDQEFCTPIASATLAGNTIIFPATGTWAIISSPSPGTTVQNINQNNSQITGLVVGETILSWTVDNGACVNPVSVDQVSIFIYPSDQLDAFAGDDQVHCQPSVSSATLAGNPAEFPAEGTWTLIEGAPAAVITDIHDPNTTVTGLGVDEYIFQWEIDNGPCGPLTTDEVSIFIYDDTQADADAGIDQELCTPDNSTFFTANVAISPAIGTWTSLGTGIIAPIDINNPIAEVTGLTVGDNFFVWEIDNNICAGGITTDTVNIQLFFDGQLDANAGNDQEMCTPDNSTFLEGNSVTYPADGLWVQTATDGVFATIVDPTDPLTEVTGLAIGNNIFEWTISNGPCGPGGTPDITSDDVLIQVFPDGAPDPEAGEDQILCSPTTQTSMTADPASNPGVGTWEVFSSPLPAPTIISPNDESTLITNLEIGVHVFTWTVDYATCGTPVDTIVITVFDGTVLPSNAGPDQEMCLPDNMATMAADPVALPGIGTWSILNGGTINPTMLNNPNAEVENLPFGENKFVWTIYNGDCLLYPETVDTVSIFVFNNQQLDADPGDDIYLCDSQLTTNLGANEAFYPAQGIWTVISGTGTFVDDTLNTTEVSNFSEGENVYMWTIDNGPCGLTTGTMTVFYAVGNQQADAGPDQAFCAPFSCTNMAGNALQGSGEGMWTVLSDPTGITFVDPNDENTSVCDLPIGQHVFQWTFPANVCGPATSDIMNIFIYSNFATEADAGPDLSICDPDNSIFLEGTIPLFPADGTWSLLSGAGTIVSENNPMTEITDLEVGENIFVWTVDNGPCGSATDTMSVFMYTEPGNLAIPGDDQSYCTPTSTATLDGNTPVFPAFGTWSSEGVATIDGGQSNNPSATVSGLVVGENVFTWTIDNGPCNNSGSVAQMSIFIYDENQPDANAGLDQELCFPDNVVTVMGANAITFPAVGTWEVLNSGVILDINNPNALVTNLTVGINQFVWTINNGPCANAITSDTITIEVFDTNMPVADAGANQEICEPESSVILDGSPITIPAEGTWTQIDGTSVAVFADEHDNTSEVSNLALGVHTFVWTADNGPCWLTTDTMTVSVFDEFSFDSDAGTNQEFCSPISCTNMEGVIPGISDDSPAFGTWIVISIVSDDDPALSNDIITIADVNDPNTQVCGLPVGQTIMMWQVYNGACNPPTADFVSIYIFDTNAQDADAGPDQEFCLPNNSAQMSSNLPVYPALGIWTGENGTIESINDINTMITDLPVGTNTFYWTIDNEPCPNMITTDSVDILIFDPNFESVSAGPDQEFCTPVSSTILEADNLLDPNTGTWSVISGTGVFTDGTHPQSEVTGLTVGINTFVWSVYNGPCENSPLNDTISVYMYDEAHPQPNAGENIEICIPTDFTLLDGNTPTIPAIGTWTLVDGSTGVIVNPNDPSTFVTGLEVGFNYFVWNIDNGPCVDLLPDTLLVSVFTPEADTANAGPDIDLCTPESIALMNAALPSIPTYGTWEQIEGPSGASISDVNDPNAEISALTVGLYVFQWTIYNGPCDVNNSFDFVNITIYDGSAPPANAGPNMMYCLPLDSIQLMATAPTFPATGTWSHISGTGTLFDGSNPNTYLGDLIPDVDSLLWIVDNGPCGITMDTLVVQFNSPEAEDANAGADIDLCDEFNTTLNGNVPLYPAIGTWSVFSGDTAIDITAQSVYNSTVFDFGLGQTVLVWTIDNGACGISTDTLLINTADGSISNADTGPDNESCGVVDQYVMQGSVTIGNTASGEWAVLDGAGDFVNSNDEHTTVFNIPIGVNVYEWTVDNGACGITSDTMIFTVFDPDIDSAFAGLDVSICEHEFTPFELDASSYDSPAVGYWSIENGDIEIENDVDNHTLVHYLGEIIEPLSTIENIMTWTIDNGVCGITLDTVQIDLIDCLTLEIPDAFSPNNDGINDVLVIPNLIHYPNNSITIFNRWGVEVFESAPYLGDWDGRSQTKVLFGTELPVSTYYIVLDLGEEGLEPITGFIYLKR